ncbi:hypothetical protein BHECKSOX2_1281 [Bathymodiolus heckerae thiotrophic gill symbiont]|nr:hypothetical protein BHECKSOX2_1281 [Bathymodiolus heckerae thiotrophic gill symbiont]
MSTEFRVTDLGHPHILDKKFFESAQKQQSRIEKIKKFSRLCF